MAHPWAKVFWWIPHHRDRQDDKYPEGRARLELREGIYSATKRANSLYLYSTFDIYSNYLSTFKG